MTTDPTISSTESPALPTGQELTDLVNRARRRVLEGEEISLEEQKMLVQILRSGRRAASEVGTKARTTRATKTKGLSDEALDSSLDDALGL